MIETKNKFLDKKCRFAAVITDCTTNNLGSVIEKFKATFKQYGEIDFCYVVTDKKKKKEEIQVPKGVQVFHGKEDLNFFRKFKNKDLKASFVDKEHDILLCSYFEKNKSVNNLISQKKAETKVGIEKETLPKFDISFLMKSENHNEFIDLSLKYLKML
jgi:hypothetical protein